jgi:hypothetical protein
VQRKVGKVEPGNPARDTVSSETTSSQAKFLVRLSSRLARQRRGVARGRCGDPWQVVTTEFAATEPRGTRNPWDRERTPGAS